MWNRFLNDDCFNVLPTIEDDIVQLLFTSVPDINDLGLDNDIDKYDKFLNDSISHFCRITKDTGFIVLCQSDRKINGKVFSKHSYLINKMEGLGYSLKDYKIVVKNSVESKDQYIFPYLHLCVFTRKGKILRKGEWLRNILVYKMSKSGSFYAWHAEFARLVITHLSNDNDLVVDPFAGTGIVPMMAKEMNRQYIGIEIDEKHFNDPFSNFYTE